MLNATFDYPHNTSPEHGPKKTEYCLPFSWNSILASDKNRVDGVSRPGREALRFVSRFTWLAASLGQSVAVPLAISPLTTALFLGGVPFLPGVSLSVTRPIT
jgi:hypothetical protein